MPRKYTCVHIPQARETKNTLELFRPRYENALSQFGLGHLNLDIPTLKYYSCNIGGNSIGSCLKDLPKSLSQLYIYNAKFFYSIQKSDFLAAIFQAQGKITAFWSLLFSMLQIASFFHYFSRLGKV